MSLRRASLALGVALALAPAEARANKVLDVLGWPFRFVGGKVAAGAADKFKPALKDVVVDVEKVLDKQQDRLGVLADDLVKDFDVSLEERILQLEMGAKSAADHALDRLDVSLRNGLAEARSAGKQLIKQADKSLKDRIAQTDRVLAERTADLDRRAAGLVARTDEALAARIEQIDEAAGRRLGNVDVIASKQRIGLERTLLRVAVLVGLVVFLVFAAIRLYRRYDALVLSEELKVTRGAPRTWALVRGLGPALAGHLTLAGAGAAALLLLAQALPFGATREAEALLARHERGLEEAATHFDYTQVRFHASQLEFLAEDAARYRAVASRAALLRDLVARPTLLASEEGLATLARRIAEAERLFSSAGRPDPDLLVLRALVLWETGANRKQEHQAASLAARALRLSPRGFALSPLARAYVETYLDAPCPQGEAEVGRDAATLAELREVLASATRERPPSPLDATIEVARLVRILDRASSTHYVKMVEAHAQAVSRPKVDGEAIARRNAHADAVVTAWTSFDLALAKLGNDPAVLAAFRLNDAVLTRAMWFKARPEVTTLAPLLETLTGDEGAKLKVKMAPPRVGWARRYRGLLAGPARDIAEFHEAERFGAWEAWTREYEEAAVAHARARDAEPAARWRVVVAAAALGLYVDEGGQRVPLARHLAAQQTTPPRPLSAQEVAAGLPATLDEALLRRGPRLL